MITNCSRCNKLISVKENDFKMCLRCLVSTDLESHRRLKEEIQKMYQKQDLFYKFSARKVKQKEP